MTSYKKHLRILSGILGYCHKVGATDFNIDMSLKPGFSYIEVRAPVASISQNQLEELNAQINIPRQREVEQNYWSLGSDSDADNMLTMVGFMTDRSFIQYADGFLVIRVERDGE